MAFPFSLAHFSIRSNTFVLLLGRVWSVSYLFDIKCNQETITAVRIHKGRHKHVPYMASISKFVGRSGNDMQCIKSNSKSQSHTSKRHLSASETHLDDETTTTTMQTLNSCYIQELEAEPETESSEREKNWLFQLNQLRMNRSIVSGVVKQSCIARWADAVFSIKLQACCGWNE